MEYYGGIHFKFKESYCDIATAARMLSGLVSRSTVRRWVISGWTSFGFSLDVIRRQGRLLIPVRHVDLLTDYLRQTPLPKPGTSHAAREEFRRNVQMLTWHPPRSVYSRARKPRGLDL